MDKIKTMFTNAVLIDLEPEYFNSGMHKTIFECYIRDISDNNSWLYVLPTGTRAIGRTSIINELGLISQILYHKNVIVLTDYTTQEHTAFTHYSLKDLQDVRNRNYLRSILDTSYVLLIDDITITKENTALLQNIFTYTALKCIPTIGYLSYNFNTDT